MGAWLVSLETMYTDDAMCIALSAALASIGGEIVGAPDSGRCLARLLVPGATSTDALQMAMEIWRTAVADSGRPGWPVFAADVVERVDPVPTAASRRKTSRKTA
ncbi:MAG TPA: hypothetical protein VNB94_03160 [Mycobacteriales bacterium]|nr:hypothetical protein [Mycobacteriales bacterium]